MVGVQLLECLWADRVQLTPSAPATTPSATWDDVDASTDTSSPVDSVVSTTDLLNILSRLHTSN